MLLSNKRVRVIVPVLITSLVLTTPPLTCDDKKKQVIEKEREVINVTNTPSLYGGVSLTLTEILKSSGEINVAEEEKIKLTSSNKDIVTTSSVSTESLGQTVVPEETEEPEKLASNGEPYKYYKVFDFFYGSKEYHRLDYNLQEYTYDLCIKYGIENYYTLILCQLYYESQYKADAVSASNDYGIAQINKCNHKWLSKELGVTDFLDAKQSILCNVYLMSSNLKKYSVESSLFCYNTGSPNGSNTYSRNIVYMWNNGVKKIEE